MYDLAKGNKPNKKMKITRDGTIALVAADTYYTKDGYQQALLEAFIKNLIPFKVVENIYFRTPFFLLCKDVDIMSASNLKRNMKSSKKEELAVVYRKISFTTDC